MNIKYKRMVKRSEEDEPLRSDEMSLLRGSPSIQLGKLFEYFVDECRFLKI